MLKYHTLLLPLALALMGCSGPASADQRREFPPPYTLDPEQPSLLVVREDLIPRFSWVVAGQSTVGAAIEGIGRLGFAPDASYAMRVPFPSHVERVLVGIGDRVTARQALAELRSSEVAKLRAQARHLDITLRMQKELVQRIEPLAQDGTASARELTEAMAAVESTQAELEGVRQALSAGGVSGGNGELFVLRASTAGTILARNLSPGERLSGEGEQPAFLIGDPERLVVRASFPERDSVWLRKGVACSFTVHALGETFPGTITRLVRAVDRETRSSTAICEPTTQDPRFSAQMVARVRVSVESEDGAERVVVPRSALLLRRDDWVVFVRAGEGRLERRAVRPGITLGDHVQILDGVRAGEEIITQGAVLLDGELDVLL